MEETTVFPFWKEDSRYTRVNYHHLELWSVDNLDQQYHEYLYTRNPYYILGDILVNHACASIILKKQLHCLDSPSIVYEDGTQWWYINGNPLPQEPVQKWIKDREASVPFDENTQVEFLLTFT